MWPAVKFEGDDGAGFGRGGDSDLPDALPGRLAQLLSAGGIYPETGLMDYHPAGSGNRRAMAERAERTMVVADHSKFLYARSGRRARPGTA